MNEKNQESNSLPMHDEGQKTEDVVHSEDHNAEFPHSALLAAMEQVAHNLSNLAEEFQKRLAYDKTKEDAFNRLYADMQESKQDAEFDRLRPVFLDLILLFDRVENTVELLSTGQINEEVRVANLLGSIKDELLEILYRREVDLINGQSSTFDASIQRVVGTEPGGKDDDNLVTRLVRRGFKYRERVLRPEEVIIKKFRPAIV